MSALEDFSWNLTQLKTYLSQHDQTWIVFVFVLVPITTVRPNRLFHFFLCLPLIITGLVLPVQMFLLSWETKLPKDLSTSKSQPIIFLQVYLQLQFRGKRGHTETFHNVFLSQFHGRKEKKD